MSNHITALMSAMLPDENSTIIMSLASMLAFAPREPRERDRYRLKVHSLFADAFAIATVDWLDEPDFRIIDEFRLTEVSIMPEGIGVGGHVIKESVR